MTKTEIEIFRFVQARPNRIATKNDINFYFRALKKQGIVQKDEKFDILWKGLTSRDRTIDQVILRKVTNLFPYYEFKRFAKGAY